MGMVINCGDCLVNDPDDEQVENDQNDVLTTNEDDEDARSMIPPAINCDCQGNEPRRSTANLEDDDQDCLLLPPMR